MERGLSEGVPGRNLRRNEVLTVVRERNHAHGKARPEGGYVRDVP